MRIVVDCANGAAYRVAPAALWELGADVISIGVEPDGFNINKECGSTAPEHAVRARCARCAPISASRSTATPTASSSSTSRATWSTATSCMAVIAESWKEDGRLAKPGVVATVMSNLGLERHLGRLGLELARTPVGDRYVLEHMREHGYNLGGEQSGHIILSDYTTTGDGFVAALQVLAVVKKHDQPVSEVCHRFDPLPQVHQERALPRGKPLEDAAVRSAIDSGASSGSTARAG